MISKLNWLNSKNSTGITTIFLLSLIVTFLLGCKSLANVESLDLDLGGLEVEFYEPPPITIVTNVIQYPYGKLMDRD